MRSAILENGLVVNVILGQLGDSIPCADAISIGWLHDGTSFLPPLPAVPVPPAVAEYEEAVQRVIDETARQKMFRDGVTMASYVASTVPEWAAQAVAFVAWRDAVWAYSYVELAKVLEGQRPQPGIDALLEELPAIVWPI